MQNLSTQNISFTTFKLSAFVGLGQWHSILFIPYLIMFLLSIISNTVIIYLIISQRSLHSPMYVLIGVMSVVDFVWPVCFVPSLLVDFLFDWNVISLGGCLSQMFFIQVIGGFQSTVLVWMAMDRFFAICRPLNYHKFMEMNNFLKFIIVPLFRIFFLNALVISLAGRLRYCSNVMEHCFCEHMGLVQLACGDTSLNNLIGLISTLLIPAADFVFIISSYVVIFASVLKSGKGHIKAFNTCITHIIVIFNCLLFVLIAFLSYRIRNNLSADSRVFLSTMYVLFPCCFNPIIYGLRTTEIRQHFLKLINNLKVSPL